MKRNISSIIGIFLCFSILAGCAQFARKDLTLIDTAKLDAKAMTIWYTGAYYSIANMMADPTLTEAQLKVLKKYINPKMNDFKRILITYIDSVALAEASRTPQIIMDESKLTGLMAAIVNDLSELGLIDRLEQKPGTTADVTLSLKQCKTILVALDDLQINTKEVTKHV